MRKPLTGEPYAGKPLVRFGGLTEDELADVVAYLLSLKGR